MLLQHTAYVIEKDDGIGQVQQVSGGFGDSTNLDEEAMQILLA
jgi:hypothetical protein